MREVEREAHHDFWRGASLPLGYSSPSLAFPARSSEQNSTCANPWLSATVSQ